MEPSISIPLRVQFEHSGIGQGAGRSSSTTRKALDAQRLPVSGSGVGAQQLQQIERGQPRGEGARAQRTSASSGRGKSSGCERRRGPAGLVVERLAVDRQSHSRPMSIIGPRRR